MEVWVSGIILYRMLTATHPFLVSRRLLSHDDCSMIALACMDPEILKISLTHTCTSACARMHAHAHMIPALEVPASPTS